MTTQELKTIYEKLRDQTTLKQLKWKALNQEALRIDFPRSSIIFNRRAPGRDVPRLSILNSGGSEVAHITNNSFATGLPAAQELTEMWRKAYEIAFETDETVQDILTKLGGK